MKLLIGGSPCTHWSIAQTKNRETEASGVCWREKAYTLKANYFKSSVTNAMDGGHFPSPMAAEPIIVNGMESRKARTVDAHMGKLESNLVPRINNPNPAKQQYDCIAVPVPEPVNETVDGKAQCLRATYYKDGIRNMVGNTIDRKTCVAEPVRIGTIENDARNQDHDSQQYRVYSPDGKSVTLCGNGGGLGAKTGLYATPVDTDADGILHLGSLYGQHSRWGVFAKDGKCPTITASMGMGGGHVPMVPTRTDEEGHCQKNPTTAKQIYEVRDGKISIGNTWYPIKLRDGFYIIRKLTVRECMRLQTVPDTYAFPVSDTQAYKMLGNGWTVDVIAHIMSHFTGLTEEPVEVLSMYDGMSCGQIALDKLGAEITAYYATEIDKYAIQTTQHNYPETVQLGDAFQVRDEEWSL